jgi:cullin 3
MEETWSALSKNIRIIQDQKETSLSFEENHRFAYNMVLHKHGAVLYNGVCALVAEHLDNLTRDRIIPTFPSGRGDDPMHQSQEAEILLKALRDVWDDHSSSMQRLGQVLKYMVLQSLDIVSLDQLIPLRWL